ncbi:hypothetical protein D9M71_845540 [compost metagenome]
MRAIRGHGPLLQRARCQGKIPVGASSARERRQRKSFASIGLGVPLAPTQITPELPGCHWKGAVAPSRRPQPYLPTLTP